MFGTRSLLIAPIALAAMLASLPLSSQAQDQPISPFPSITKSELEAMPVFAIAIEQDGEIIEARDHDIKLKKKPFTLIVYFKQPEGVLVHASLEPDMYLAAKTDKPIETAE